MDLLGCCLYQGRVVVDCGVDLGLGVLGEWDPITDGDLVHNRGDGSSILTYKWGLLIPY